MTILLTGAAGFIGSHLTEQLLALGHRVVGLDNFDAYYPPHNKEKNLQPLYIHNSFELVRGDVRNQSLLVDVLRRYNCDTVIHLAAKAGVRASVCDPAQCLDVNINGTLALLEAMRQTNVGRLILASSSSVYGNSSLLPFREDDPADRPLSPYAQSKRATELLAHTYHHLYGIDVSCLRFFTVYGPRQRPEMAISLFVDSLYRSRPITIYGDGTTTRNYTYISDTIQGIILAANQLSGFQTLNIGGPAPISLIDLVRLLERTTGQSAHIDWQPAHPGDVVSTDADLCHTFTQIGYQPAVTIQAGTSQYNEWYLSAVRVNA